MNRILLLRPDSQLEVVRRLRAFLHLEPLALEYLAASVPPGNEVRILDLTILKRPLRQLQKTVKSFKPDLVGITAYSNQKARVAQCVDVIKKNLLTPLSCLADTTPPSSRKNAGFQTWMPLSEEKDAALLQRLFSVFQWIKKGSSTSPMSSLRMQRISARFPSIPVWTLFRTRAGISSTGQNISVPGVTPRKTGRLPSSRKPPA